MKSYVIDDYKEWLVETVYDDRPIRRASYDRLLDLLFDIPFRYSIDFDGNRKIDGEELRQIYVYDGGDREILKWREQCTVLEFLIALAYRIQQITENPHEDITAGYWFWVMISNLGLNQMSNSNFNKRKVISIIDIFLDREYDYDGSNGNIFIIKDTSDDLRDVEIWQQMCWYLNTII